MACQTPLIQCHILPARVLHHVQQPPSDQVLVRYGRAVGEFYRRCDGGVSAEGRREAPSRGAGEGLFEEEDVVFWMREC